MNNETKPSIYSASLEEISKLFAENNFEKFRAKQLLDWLYNKYAFSWDEMVNLPKALRTLLAQTFLSPDETISNIECVKDSTGTSKILSKLFDGELIESVIIPAKDRNTVCISSQVGCACKCVFCASGLNGLTRHLSIGEIVGQVLLAAKVIGKKPDNIVYMGIGEPFMNYDNVIASARIINDVVGIGARKITISTSGIVPSIKKFAEEGIQLELSVSLHAPNPALRDQIMPINKRYKLDELMKACREYTAKTNRIITFEYTLIDDINNLPEHAEQLVKLLRGLKCRINLIPLNPVKEYIGKTPPDIASEWFLKYLQNHGINTTLRRSKGRGVNASCGQLRRSKIKKD